MNQYLPRVNEKLSFARILLKVFTTLEDKNDADIWHQRQAYIESIVVHLMQAYRLYLYEIADNYQISTLQSIDNEKALYDLLKQQNKESAETNELLELEKSAGSWLNRLCLCYQSVISISPSYNKISAERENSLIQSVSLEDNEPDGSNLKSVQEYYQAMLELIERGRETMVEY